jgi:predicted AAA+ superfamily ATPase
MLRDIVERHRVSNVAALRALTLQLICNPGCQASITKLSKDLTSQCYPIGKDTIRALMDHLADAFLIRRMKILSDPSVCARPILRPWKAVLRMKTVPRC